MTPKPTPYEGPERRAPASRLMGLLVLALLAGIVFATLCPLDWRPHLADAALERFFAFWALGAALCLFLPRRWPAALAFVVFLAVSLEAGQLFAPGRDAHTSDATVKALGGIAGVLSVNALFWAARNLRLLPQASGAGATL